MKTIYISKIISDQESLDESVKKINGKVPSTEREQIHHDFNNNIITEISVTVNIVSIGGVRYLKNGHDIEIIFVGDFTYERQKQITDRIQYNIK